MMRYRSLFALALCSVLFILAGCATSEPATQGPREPVRVEPKVEGEALVFGYHPYWLEDRWRSYAFNEIDKLFFFEIEAGGNGTLQARHGWPDRWEPLLQQARNTSTPIVPVVTLFNREAFIELFSSASARQRFRDEILAMIADAGADGVHLDAEVQQSVPEAARSGFTTFVGQLQAEMRRRHSGAILSLFGPAFDRADVFDEAALAEVVDYIVVQGYDIFWRGSEQTGPVAPLRGWQGNNWESIVDRYLQLGVPPEKIIMSVPFYGYEWPTESDAPGARTRGRGQTISYAPVASERFSAIQVSARDRAAQHGLQRDPQSRSPYYVYQDSTGWHQGWFEDAESLAAKYDFIKRRNLGGLAVFPLGYDDGELLQTIR